MAKASTLSPRCNRTILPKLSADQRNQLIQRIGEIRDNNRELSSEDRQAMFDTMVDRALQGRR